MSLYRFDVSNKAGTCHYRSRCPAVLGSNPQAAGAACHGVSGDPYVSRHQLRVEELTDGRLRVENLSLKVAMTLHDGAVVAPGGSLEVALPMRVSVGETRIDIDAVDNSHAVDATTLIPIPPDPSLLAAATLAELGPSPAPERLAQWFERVIAVLQQAAASTDMFNRETARAAVELVGLDRGLVLARKGTEWDIVAAYPEPDGPVAKDSFSRAVLDEVVRTGVTVYDPGRVSRPSASLQSLGAVVAAPWCDPRDGCVVGAVLRRRAHDRLVPGRSPSRHWKHRSCRCLRRQRRRAERGRSGRSGLPSLPRRAGQDTRPGSGGTRRGNAKVTILSSDLRGSSRMAGRLGNRYFDLSRDLMEQLTGRIAEQGGMVVDYAGDGILAMWNAPEVLSDHAAKACLAALAMHTEMTGLNRHWADALAHRWSLESASTRAQP